MKPRNLYILLAVVLAVGTFLWLVERDLPSPEERERQARKVLDLESEDVERIVVENRGSRAVLERRRGEHAESDAEGDAESDEGEPEPEDGTASAAGSWWLTEPLEAPADEHAVDSLLSSLLRLEKERTLTDYEAGPLGLAEPSATVTLTLTRQTGGGETVELAFGAELPAGGGRVAAVAGRGEAYVVDGAVLAAMDREPRAWRATELLPGSRWEIESVTLTLTGKARTQGEAAGRRLHFERRGSGDELWLAASPEGLSDRVDSEPAEALLSALGGLRVAAFLDDLTANDEEMGLEPPALRAAVRLRAGRPVFEVELGLPAGEVVDGAAGRFFGRVGSQRFEIETALPELASRPASSWRSLDWTPLNAYQVAEVELEDGEGALKLERDGVRWLRTGEEDGGEEPGEEIEASTVTDLLYAVADARGERLLNEVEEASLPASPQLSLTLRKEIEVEGAAPERLALFAFGEAAAVRQEGRDAAVLLAAETAAELRVLAAAVREAEAVASDQESSEAEEAERAEPDAEQGRGS